MATQDTNWPQIPAHWLRVIGQIKLSYDEMNTILKEMACLNYRPLWAETYGGWLLQATVYR